jgi:hypothetical protein
LPARSLSVHAGAGSEAGAGELAAGAPPGVSDPEAEAAGAGAREQPIRRMAGNTRTSRDMRSIPKDATDWGVVQLRQINGAIGMKLARAWKLSWRGVVPETGMCSAHSTRKRLSAGLSGRWAFSPVREMTP